MAEVISGKEEEQRFPIHILLLDIIPMCVLLFFSKPLSNLDKKRTNLNLLNNNNDNPIIPNNDNPYSINNTVNNINQVEYNAYNGNNNNENNYIQAP